MLQPSRLVVNSGPYRFVSHSCLNLLLPLSSVRHAVYSGPFPNNNLLRTMSTAASSDSYAKLALESTDPRDKVLVIRELLPGMLTFSQPFARFGVVPIGGRSTAIRLDGKGIFVYVSHPLTTATEEALKQLGGEVKWLVTPDGEHGINITAWSKAYPDAMPIGVKRHGAEKPDVKWAGLFGAGGEEKTYGFEPEISLYNVSAHVNDELVAIHHPSGTLLEADLLFNLPPTEQYSRSSLPWWFRFFLGSGSSASPGGILHNLALKGIIKDRALAEKQFAPILAAKWDRIVPCHGDIIEANGRAMWDKVFKSFEKPKDD